MGLFDNLFGGDDYTKAPQVQAPQSWEPQSLQMPAQTSEPSGSPQSQIQAPPAPDKWSEQNQQYINLAKSISKNFDQPQGGSQEVVPGFGKAAEKGFGPQNMNYGQISNWLKGINQSQLQAQPEPMRPMGPMTSGAVMGDLGAGISQMVGSAIGGMKEIEASSSKHQILNSSNLFG